MILKAVILCARCNHEFDVVQFETSQGFVWPRTPPRRCPRCEDKMHFGGLTHRQLVDSITAINEMPGAELRLADFFLALAHSNLPEDLILVGQAQGQKIINEVALESKPRKPGGRPPKQDTDDE